MNIPALRWAKDQFISARAKTILSVLILNMDDDSYVSTFTVAKVAIKLGLSSSEALSSLIELINLNLIQPLFDFSHFNLERSTCFLVVGAYKEAIWR